MKQIGSYALNNCPRLTDIYYAGSESQWKKVEIGSNNDVINRAAIHFNSPWDPKTATDLSELRQPDPATLDVNTAVISKEGSMKTYSFMNGKLTLRFDPAVYDVILQNNDDNEEVLNNQGISSALIDLYMSMLGYQLVAVPTKVPFTSADAQFYLHIKEPAYEGIDNLKSLNVLNKVYLGQMLAAGYGLSPDDVELVQTDTADYYLFEILGAVRYATIIDGRMIYFYVTARDGILTDQHRMMLDSIMEGVSWDFSR